MPDAPPGSRADREWDEIEGAKECGFLQWLQAGTVHSSFGRKRPAPGGCDIKGDYQINYISHVGDEGN